MNPVLLILPFFTFTAAVWGSWHERRIIEYGEPLNEESLADARRMGVGHPEKIRILRVMKIPVLNGWLIRRLARFVPAISANTVGVSLRYGIYLRDDYPQDRRRQLIAHECVHTGQYEKSGSFTRFMWQYFSECVEYGYPAAPLEMEAITRSGMIKVEPD